MTARTLKLVGLGTGLLLVSAPPTWSTLLAEDAPPTWSAPSDVPGPKKGDKTTVWTLLSLDESGATLEVRCTRLYERDYRSGETSTAEIILVTKASLLNMADDDGEIDIVFSFDGGKLQERSTRIIKGYHGVYVSEATKDVKRFLKNDGKPYMIRVSGHGSQAVFNFALAGAVPVKLGGACVQ